MNAAPRSPASLVLAGFLVIAGFFLLTEHRAHVFGILPLLLLLACPLLHFFMHGSHGRHGRRHHDASDLHAGHRTPGQRVP